jgi:hypothetical protein
VKDTDQLDVVSQIFDLINIRTFDPIGELGAYRPVPGLDRGYAPATSMTVHGLHENMPIRP